MTKGFLKLKPVMRGLLAIIVCAVAASVGLAQQEAPDVAYSAGLTAFNAGDYAGAAKIFQDLVDRFGKEPELKAELEGVYYALGCALYNQQLYDQAIQTFESYVSNYPSAKFADEAVFRIGSAWQAGEDYDKAVAGYKRVAAKWPQSPFAEDAAFQAGICYMIRNAFANAVTAFEEFRKAYPDSDLSAQATMYLARALFENNQLGAAVDALASLEGRGQKLDTIVYANFLAIEIGDVAFDNTDYDLALRAYRRVRTKASLLRLQKQYIQDLEVSVAALQKQAAGQQSVASRFRQERRLTSSLNQAKSLQTRLDEMPDYDAGLMHRIGRCFFNSDRYWEARIAFTRVLQVAQDEALREAAHFDLILCLSRQRQFEDLIGEADKYLAEYK